MPGDTGTGSNFKGMLVFDLAILQNTALLELAHDSLLFKNLKRMLWMESAVFMTVTNISSYLLHMTSKMIANLLRRKY